MLPPRAPLPGSAPRRLTSGSRIGPPPPTAGQARANRRQPLVSLEPVSARRDGWLLVPQRRPPRDSRRRGPGEPDGGGSGSLGERRPSLTTGGTLVGVLGGAAMAPALQFALSGVGQTDRSTTACTNYCDVLDYSLQTVCSTVCALGQEQLWSLRVGYREGCCRSCSRGLLVFWFLG